MMGMPPPLPGRKLRLLHVIASVDPASGGPIEGILRQDEALNGAGAREIVSLDSPDAPFLSGFPLLVHPLGSAEYRPGPRGRISRFGYSAKLIPWLRENVGKYDAIIVNGLWSFASVAASRVLPRQDKPYFVFPHGMMDPWFRKTYPIKHLQKQAFWFAFDGPLLSNARAVLFTTEEEKRLAQGEFWGHRYTGEVVGYGTAPPPPPDRRQAIAFQQAAPTVRGRRYLVFLSRIHPKKGCDLLLEAFAAIARDFPDLDLVIAGPDHVGWVPKLQKQAIELRIAERLHWPGPLYGDAKWGAIRGAEAFVLPSHQENFGIVVAEALACGTPVLITDKVNIWREVSGGGAGIVHPDDAAGTEASIRAWLALSKEEKDRMRAAARSTFDAHFDVGVTAARLVQFMASFE